MEEKQKEREGRKRAERKKGGENKREIFLAFRLLELDGPRRKVDPRIASYAWVPISWSFVKLREVGNFPTWIRYKGCTRRQRSDEAMIMKKVDV